MRDISDKVQRVVVVTHDLALAAMSDRWNPHWENPGHYTCCYVLWHYAPFPIYSALQRSTYGLPPNSPSEPPAWRAEAPTGERSQRQEPVRTWWRGQNPAEVHVRRSEAVLR